MIKRRTTCRVCKGSGLVKVWDFGTTPLANAFLTRRQLDQPEQFYPLEVNYCNSCSNVQLAHVVDPETLFDNYLYVSSTSPSFVKHFEDFASEMFGVRSVLDIGSNDGILLKPFEKRGVEVLGIEPAQKIAQKANEHGIPTLNEYFSASLARSLGKFDLVTATNVFAHIDDLDDVLKGVKTVLNPGGQFVIENPYLVDQVKSHAFDLVYHEHLQYWSLNALRWLYKIHGFSITRVEHTPVHGGSIRVYATRGPSDFKPPGESINLGNFMTDVRDNRAKLVSLLVKLKSWGKMIVGYGAPAKSTTLLNYFGIGKDILDFIIDDSPIKQGLYTPGTHIPIVKSARIQEKSDFILILAWNFSESIIKKCRDSGYKGKFIIPIPKPRII